MPWSGKFKLWSLLPLVAVLGVGGAWLWQYAKQCELAEAQLDRFASSIRVGQSRDAAVAQVEQFVDTHPLLTKNDSGHLTVRMPLKWGGANRILVVEASNAVVSRVFQATMDDPTKPLE